MPLAWAACRVPSGGTAALGLLNYSLGMLQAVPILAVAMIASIALRDGPAPDLASREIWVSAWKDVPAGLRYVTPMLWLEGDYRPGQDNESIDPEPLARASKSLPEGRRVLLWYRYFRSFWGARQDAIQLADRNVDGPWSQFAVTQVRSEWSRFLQLYKYCGGALDLVVGDCEEWGRFTSWSLSPGQLDAIRLDTRFGEALYGCPSLRDLTTGFALEEVASSRSYTSSLKWNCAIGRFTAAVMSHAIWEPAVAAFPRIKGSNYDGKLMVDRPAPDLNGHPQPSENRFGSSSSPVAYGAIQQASTAWFIDDSDPTQLSRTGVTRLKRGSWQSFLIDVQLGRACRRGSPNSPLMPWIALPTYAGDLPGLVGYPEDRRLWSEMVRHYALFGTSVFLWWNTTSLPGPGGTSVPALGRDQMAKDLNALMLEINGQTGGLVQRTISTVPVSFRASIVTSGAVLTDGTRLWRVTVQPGIRRIKESFGGSVLEIPAGELGVWISRRDEVVPDYQPAPPDQN